MLKAVAGGGRPSAPITQSGEFLVTLSGLSNPPQTEFEWNLIAGSLVALTCKGTGLWTSNSTDLAIPVGTLPQAIRPFFGLTVPCGVVNNNQPFMGRAVIASQGAGGAGGITFDCPTADGNFTLDSFTASGTKGIPLGATILYPLTADL